jgi:nucleotide-binding universal stress UspA family protein
MKKFLVALDNSERAPGVLQTAQILAQTTGAKLTLLRAIPWPTELPSHAYPLTPADFEAVSQRIAGEELEALIKHVPPELIEARIVRLGTPWKEICDVSKEIGADLIIVGAHGYTFFERVLGTTASRVSNHADRSVLLVREPPASANVLLYPVT